MSTPPAKPASDPPAVDRTGGSHAGRIVKSTLSIVLITLTCILVPVSLIAVWVHDIALDTDRYVSTIGPLARNAAVQDAAVNRIGEAAGVRVDGDQVASDLAAWLESQGLPPRVGTAFKALGPKIDDAAQQVVEKVAGKFVRSDRFATIWADTNRRAHSSIVHALTGEGRGAVGVDDGTVTLDVGAAVESVKQELVDAGLAPAAHIPDVDKKMVLLQSDKLSKIRGAAHLLDVVGNWLPVLTVLLGTSGVLLARRRRRALVTVMLGAAGVCLIFAIGLAVARHYYLDHLPAQVQSPGAAAAIFDTLLHFLKVSIRTALVLGVVVALGAYLSGVGRLPRAVRGTAERAADSAARWGAAHGVHTGQVGTWTVRYRKWLTTGVLLLLALIFALWNHPTVLTVLLLVLILLAVLALLALLAATGRTTDARADGAGHEAG
ncbi:hypothetical protein [Streptomyces sp. RKAG293]|uniref:hypothetical protein n=1 Tax=Streptomyces sp. RKAG293 TaxID=2893403 RepID=UPI0020342BE7|nr:hypothetical protein [Streptomyces sp. RKAG293]MCM2417791.1 hypothetical protein [Streptomyces sp. RKAG293]